jgi:hypothetical protein
MRTTPYRSFPFILNWMKDSSVKGARRKADPSLQRIDSLVKSYNFATSGGSRRYLLGELYFTTNWWLRNFRGNPQMQEGREPAIRQLCHYAIRQLAAAFGCGINAVPTYLERFYGREMDFAAHRIDAEKGERHYLDRAEAEKYKLIFINGHFYQFPWWSRSALPTDSVRLADSGYAYAMTGNVDRSTMEEDWGFFTMSMSRDIYMAGHRDDFFHSAYLAGGNALCAGGMLIKKGVVKAIRNNSGHYKPLHSHQLNLLEHLKMLGYRMEDIEVYSFEDQHLSVKGDVYMKAHGNWDVIETRARENLKDVEARLADMDEPRQRWLALKAGKVTLRDLVERQFNELNKSAVVRTLFRNPADIWKRAYRETCAELGLFDPAWKTKVNHPPIPMSKAPGMQRKKPRIPGKSGRPKLDPRTGRPVSKA